VPMDIFEDLNDLAHAAGWIADQSGGWNSTATIAFLKNVAANWEWENIDEILHAAGWVSEKAGSWTADASISFIAGLFDRYGTEYDDMPYWLDKMGVGASEIPSVIAKIIMQAYQGDGMAIDDIDDYLTSLGITDVALSRSIKVNLIYDMVSTGDLSLEEVAKFAYNQAYAAWITDDAGLSYHLLKELEGLAGMWGINWAAGLGGEVNTYGGYNSDPQAWTDLWNMKMGYSSWAEGGIVNSPTMGLVGEAGYPEAIIPMKDGVNIPVKWVNGGSTQGGAEQGDRPINITVQVGGHEFDAHIASISDGVRVKAERRPIGARRI
jgi:hypothetical protein